MTDFTRVRRFIRQLQESLNSEISVAEPLPSMVTPLIGTHEGVSCDGCSMTAFVGNRYKCLRCSDYDLCFNCYTAKQYGEHNEAVAAGLAHDDTHPMQLILSSIDFEAVYEGDPTRRYDERKIVSFTCPYCNITGFTDQQFGVHVTAAHPDAQSFTVICPLCIGIADMEHSHSRETDNLCSHWLDHHSQAVDASARQDLTANRPAQRRPMLARRAQRTVNTRPIARVEEIAAATELSEMIRNMRPGERQEEEIRRITEMLGTAAPVMMIRNAQRMTERAPVILEPQPQVREDQLVHQVIRPLSFQPVYPPTSEDSGDETPQPAADSADESDTGSLQDEPAQTFVEDEELTNNEFWKTLKTRISADDVALILETMKTSAKVGREDREDKLPVWTPRPLKPMANTAQPTATTTSPDADGDQGWLPVVLETTPIRSAGCGGYWSDKRFLRPRKMQREQSVNSSNAEILEKAEVALAFCRASCLQEPVFSDPTKPDISLREALEHLNLGGQPGEMMEYQAAREFVQNPDRDPITTGDEDFEMPDFTSRGYCQIVDGSVPLGVLPEADEAITLSEDEEVEASSAEDEDDDTAESEDDSQGSQDSSIPDEINIIS